MLEEILRHNHRITKHRDADNRSLTLEINNCRKQLWWTNMKANNRNFKRNKMSDRPIQRGGGQITPYDKIPVDMLGADWMNEAKLHHSSKSWINKCRPHIDNFIAKLGIQPNPLTKANDTQPDTQGTRQNTSNAAQPSLLRQFTPHQNRPEQDNNDPDEEDTGRTEGLNEEWKPTTANTQCIKTIVDNQTLADIIHGDAVLKHAKIISAISRILNRLETWMNNGWSTPTAATPYVNWRYREYNKSADEMCNKVMNQEASVFYHTQGRAPRENHTHIFGQSDGGCRFKGTSATGYSIRTCNTYSNTTTVITTGGNHIDANMSSLTVEAHALDELTD